MRGELTAIRDRACGLVNTPAWALSEEDLVASVEVVFAAQQALSVVLAHLVREVDRRDLPGGHGATGVAAWLRGKLRIGVHAARRLVELSRALDRRPVLDRALGTGEVNVEQATVIAAAVADLPTTQVDADVVDKAELALIGYADQFDPDALRKLGRRILDRVAPDLSDEIDRRRLERDEAKARRNRGLTFSAMGDSRVRLSGWLDAEAAATVHAALDPLCAPRQSPAGDERTLAQRRADALVDVCGLALGTDTLPDHGGQRPHLVITIPYEPLTRQLGVGMLDTGELLSPTAVRRLACDAQILPAVLGSDGQVLDLGMTRRLFTGPVRHALILRDGGCAFPGCDRPARWTEAHHIVSWLSGGPTNLDNGVLLCGHHHRLIHQDEWQVRSGPDRQPEFLPPAYVDPKRQPRRNTYHRRT